MKEDRTYGIEIEFASRLHYNDVRDLLNQTFLANGSIHRAKSGWHSCNATRWIVKEDGSINTTPDFPFKVEINSAVLKGNDGLAELKMVCDVIESIAHINRSCGLHVHHGVLASDCIHDIVMAWMNCEDTIYDCLPHSRRGHYSMPIKLRYNERRQYASSSRPARHPNRYGSSYSPVTSHDLREVKEIGHGADQWYRDWVSSRYCGINLQSLSRHNTIEIRAHSGTYEFEKIWMWLEVTQALIAQSQGKPEVFQDGIDNVVDALLGKLSLGQAPEMVPMEKPAVFKMGIKKFIFDSLITGEWVDRYEVAEKVLEKFNAENRNTIRKGTKDVNHYAKNGINYIIKEIRKLNLQVITSGNKVKVLLPMQEQMANVIVRHDNVEVDDDVAKAAEWLRRRHATFATNNNNATTLTEENINNDGTANVNVEPEIVVEPVPETEIPF